MKQLGKHPAKDRWPENQSGGDLSADQGLSKLPEQKPEETRSSDDHDQLDDDGQENILGMTAGWRHDRSPSASRGRDSKPALGCVRRND